MNREIKFRVWNDEWVMMIQKEIYGLKFDETGIFSIQWINETTDGQEHKEVWENSEYLKIMQYTGLKDKNGKEIYEGDVCNDGSVVQFIGGRYILMYKDKTFWEDLMGSEDEIIGNVYENPELIK
jgi:uncharacterized phage protein (TIGR01671 family)